MQKDLDLDFHNLEEAHINIASDKIGNLDKFKSSNDLITIYIPEESSSTEHIGEIFSINKNSFPEINRLILYINKIYETDSYEYILDLDNIYIYIYIYKLKCQIFHILNNN